MLHTKSGDSSMFIIVFVHYIIAVFEIEALHRKYRRTDPTLGGELGEAKALAGIQKLKCNYPLSSFKILIHQLPILIFFYCHLSGWCRLL
jgi:hypothetical protein